jgi:hypothetical protein
MTHLSFMMILMAAAVAVFLQAILAMLERNLSGVPDQDAMQKTLTLTVGLHEEVGKEDTA